MLFTLSIACTALAVSAAPASPEPFVQRLEGTTLEMRLVPVEIPGPEDGQQQTIWMGATEVTWDWFDAFVYGLDEADAEADGADALTMPSRPYIAMDRGFGRAGFPAISMTHKNAEAFCAWLSARTGKRYRLPTAEEWLAACAASGIDERNLDGHAWHRGNSNAKTQPVGATQADANGLYDLLGNAAEWATDRDGKPVVLGGSYLTPASELGCNTKQRPSPDWNASDPQFPPSEWWLADAGFVGFRVVLEMHPESPDGDTTPRPANQDKKRP
ncbi:MAG: formylglycine-generating enzyme family protein [Phycisphaerales bacterium]|nr:formylglycine-generating enzyme family protein [Phycisphaerales bacterium]